MNNCPKCGGKSRLPAPHTAWCPDCGAISCPKCGSERVVNGKVKNWELPSIACQICGWREEVPIKPVLPMEKKDWAYKRPNGPQHKIPCKDCGKMIDGRGKLAMELGICHSCNKDRKVAAYLAENKARRSA